MTSIKVSTPNFNFMPPYLLKETYRICKTTERKTSRNSRLQKDKTRSINGDVEVIIAFIVKPAQLVKPIHITRHIWLVTLPGNAGKDG